MKGEEGGGGQTHKPDRQYKKALLYFVGGYLVFVLFSVYSFFGRLIGGMGEASSPVFSANQLAFQYFFIYFGFLTAVVSQIWLLYTKPRRKSQVEEQQDSHIPYLRMGVVFLVSLAFVNYLVRVGAYFAGENVYWGETYPEDTSLHMLDSVLRQVNGPISLLFLILGPVYAIGLLFQIFRIRNKEEE